MSDSPAKLVVLPIDAIDRCPIQARVNVSRDLISKLADSMRAGRHEPFLEVEPAPGQPGRYQVLCGEQRWRAAKEAGLAQVLVRLHRPFGYRERLRKQFEENRLRADLDPLEEAKAIVLFKQLEDISRAEQLLRHALVPFQPLDDKHITEREEFAEHLDRLKHLLRKAKLHVIRSGDQLIVAPLSPWRETEEALGISEATRRAKVGILRLDPATQEQVRDLPIEHAIQISRLESRSQQKELAERGHDLSHRQVQAVVERLQKGRQLDVAAAVADVTRGANSPDPEPLAFVFQLETLADLCRQLARLLFNLNPRVDAAQRARVIDILGGLRENITAFEVAAP